MLKQQHQQRPSKPRTSCPLSASTQRFNFCSSAEGIAPIFTQKPLIKQEQGGKRLIFECKLSADPKPDLFWSHDDKPIENAGRFLIYCDPLPNNGYVACLSIDDVVTGDGGKYKVTAKNTLGESNAHIDLNLESKWFVTCLVRRCR